MREKPGSSATKSGNEPRMVINNTVGLDMQLCWIINVQKKVHIESLR